SGKLDLIQDYSLRNDLLMYQLSAKELEYQGNAQLDFFMDRIVPWFIENPKFASSLAGVEQRMDFLVLISFYSNTVQNKTRKYIDIVDDAKSIQSKLEKLIEEEYDVKDDQSIQSDSLGLK
ncbi:MAG: hypothetical protein AAF789_11105, partial [Bacteroidota bacterium]